MATAVGKELRRYWLPTLIQRALLAACMMMLGCNSAAHDTGSLAGGDQAAGGSPVDATRANCPLSALAELSPPGDVIGVTTDGSCLASYDPSSREVVVGANHVDTASCVIVVYFADGRALTATVQFLVYGHGCPPSAIDASAFQIVDRDSGVDAD